MKEIMEEFFSFMEQRAPSLKELPSMMAGFVADEVRRGSRKRKL